MAFEFRPVSDLPDVIVVRPKTFGDDRGWFMETFKATEFEAHGIPAMFPQDNHSRSTARGVLRGLHYQMDPMAQGKLVRCLVGTVFDVAVDIRRGSPTCGRWVGVELSAVNRDILWIPPGFAHGFCALTDVAEIAYKTSAEYSAPHDRAIRWNDPTLGIAWPIATPVLSTKDAAAPLFADAENTFQWSGR